MYKTEYNDEKIREHFNRQVRDKLRVVDKISREIEDKGKQLMKKVNEQVWGQGFCHIWIHAKRH